MYKQCHDICLSMTYFTHESLGPSMLLQMALFHYFCGWIIFHCVYALHLLYPFICWRAPFFRNYFLLPPLSTGPFPTRNSSGLILGLGSLGAGRVGNSGPKPAWWLTGRYTISREYFSSSLRIKTKSWFYYQCFSMVNNNNRKSHLHFGTEGVQPHQRVTPISLISFSTMGILKRVRSHPD